MIGFGLSPLVTAPLARQLVEYFGVLKAFLVLGTGFAVFFFRSYHIRSNILLNQNSWVSPSKASLKT